MKNNNHKIQLVAFNDGIRQFGNLYGCQVRQESGMKMVGSIMQRGGVQQAVFLFPESELANIEKVIARKGSLYDLHVLQVGARLAELEDEFEITTSYITEETWSNLTEQEQKAFQPAQRYDGDRVPENLRILNDEDGNQLYRSTSLVPKGYRRDDLYLGRQILQQPESKKVNGKPGAKVK